MYSRVFKYIAFFSVLAFGSVSIVWGGDSDAIQIHDHQRIALVGNSTAERMSLFGNFETRFQLRFADKKVQFRNFGWPADEVGIQQRPGNYTEIDDPFLVFAPDLLICFFGFNESFSGASDTDMNRFVADYEAYLAKESDRLAGVGSQPRFVLVSPIAFENTGNRLQPDGRAENDRLGRYTLAIKDLADAKGLPFVDLFTPTMDRFDEQPGAQYTINGVHLNEQGDALVGSLLDASLFGESASTIDTRRFNQVKEIVNEKSWLHLQDYRMLNGWYVYGGRRTWDTETFPGEYQKIRKMVAVRDAYLWDLAAGRSVPSVPDDSATGEVFIPETMFGTRDEGFRAMREPKTLEYPTPEQSIAQMKVPDGFKVEMFASEREFPELANPTQIAFDSKGRLWVSCMVNYPQWLPGKSRPNDRLLILEDTDGDGKADVCKTFYDKLICPTGFEFYKDGVIVVDEPSLLFIRDTDGDDKADEVTRILDGIGTDDTHHAMGAWEYSPGGLLHMLEGIAMSTGLETPWGPHRYNGASGSYVWDLESLKLRHFRTPGHYNPWCLVFDKEGNGVIGDGTNANQHWTNPLSGGEVQTRSSIDAIFDNEGIRPAAGNEFLTTRQFPDEYHRQLIYACVINLHGMPSFEVTDDADTCGLTGKRVANLIESDDMFFRPVDPKIGPDGALWFGDWCNALIGHMQYSQRDPNRDHEHGRIYRLVNTTLPLVTKVTQADASIEQLLEQLTAYETRTRYRARRELVARDEDAVATAVKTWAAASDDPEVWREALWVQESMHRVDGELVSRIMTDADSKARAAAVHVVGNQWEWMDDPNPFLWQGVTDADARVRMEAVRGASLQPTPEAVKIALKATRKPMDKWIEYVLSDALQTLQPVWESADGEALVASLPAEGQAYLKDFIITRGPGADIHKPLKVMVNVDAKQADKEQALLEVVASSGGDAANGKIVFNRVCAACHQHGELGKKFGPNLSDVGDRMTKHEIIRSIVWPNDTIAKGYETILILDYDGNTTNGFVLAEDDEEITLGIADGKTKTVAKDDIEIRKEMKASSMPEGLTETIAPKEFMDLVAFLSGGWIATNPNLDFNLQEYEGMGEVSRQTHVKLDDGFPIEMNDEAQHLLSHEGLRKNTYAFHSANQSSESTDVIIRFNDPTIVRFVKIFNRRDAQFHDRAKGLAMWTSNDGKEWKQVWMSEEAYPDWSFGLPGDQPIKYAKFALTRPGIFHLDRVTFYGDVILGGDVDSIDNR
ncbi:Cytochrome c [Rubripirellula tenax]|uniref:Cytochrome c n=2 Tax=Rubripirellula tenax TaxID=2528015 RepID=A0A5C6FEA3_9BACT|nr:Cytochrome c [Rubripirellula tenax]